MTEQQIAAHIANALREAMDLPPATEEQLARRMVAGIDAMLREHGGEAHFISVRDGEVHYTAILPPPLLAAIYGD